MDATERAKAYIDRQLKISGYDKDVVCYWRKVQDIFISAYVIGAIEQHNIDKEG